MANKKFSELPAGAVTAAIILAGVAGGVTSKFTGSDLASGLRGADDCTVAYVDGTETIDAAAGGSCRLTNDLDGNTVLTFSNAANGLTGRVWACQNGTGGYTLSATFTGATTRLLGGAVDTTADSCSLLGYDCATTDGALVCGYWMAGSNDLTATTLTVNRISATPATFTTTAGAATLDVSANNDYRQTDSMDAVTLLTLTGCSDGRQGTINIVQDATGRVVTFAHSGRTVYDSQAVPTTASARIAIGYECVSTDSLYVFPTELAAQ